MTEGVGDRDPRGVTAPARGGRWHAARVMTGVFALLCAPVLAATQVPVSPTQQAWLRQHPTVTLGVADSQWMPFESIQGNKVEGLGYDYLTSATQRLGLKLTVARYKDWKGVLAAACAGEVDIVMNIGLTADRTQCLVYTRPYASAPEVIVGRLDDTRVAADPELTGLRVVTEEHFATDAAARSRYPNAIHIPAASTADAIAMVASGQADAYIGNQYVADDVVEKKYLKSLGLVRQGDIPLSALHLAVPNRSQPLAEALDTALAMIPAAERTAIDTKWLQPSNGRIGRSLALTAPERVAMARGIRLALAPDSAPLSFEDNGRPSGIAGEYLDRFKAAGAVVTLVPASDWAELRGKIDGGQIDAVLGMPVDSPLPKGWSTSTAFTEATNVIVTRRGAEGVLDIGDLDGLRIALSDARRLRTRVQSEAPAGRIVPVSTVGAGLQAVQDGRADAYVGNLAVVERALQGRVFANVQVAAPAGFADEFALAASVDAQPLVSVFNRMLATMSPRERESIRGDWLSVEFHGGPHWRELLSWLGPIGLAVALSGLALSIGLWRARGEVRRRRSAEEQLAKIGENLPAVVYQARLRSSGELIFPFIAGNTQTLFGIGPAEAMRSERALFSRVHPQDQDRLQADIQRSALTLTPVEIEFRTALAEGERWVRSRAQPYRQLGGELVWSGYWVDVTELRAQAAELDRARGAAETAAAAKSDFLAIMSHEIRTPMSGVLGLLEMLQAGALEPGQRRILDTIDSSARMLRQILDDILDFSRIDAGSLALHPVPVSLREVVRSVTEMFAGQAAAKGVEISVTVEAAVAERHLADGERLRQVLFNIVGNAVKFTPQGKIGVEVAALGEAGTEQSLQLSVTDSGVGIADSQQAQLFMPFTQASGDTARQFGGSGLGLSISRRLVELMGGTIELHSTLGKGTQVAIRVTLPRAADEIVGARADGSAIGEQSRDETTSWGSYRVLAVEDHPTNQLLIEWQLGQIGVGAHLVADGAAALTELRRHRYDLMITDCQMPIMDGFELARRLRLMEAERGSRRMPVIGLSASAHPEQVEQCAQAGMDAFLAKPLELQSLKVALAEHLGTVNQASSRSAPSDEYSTPALDRTPGPPFLTKDALASRFADSGMRLKIVESILSETNADLEQIASAYEKNQPATVADRLHRIAGGLAVLGEDALSMEAAHLCAAVRIGRLGERESDLLRLSARLHEYMTHLRNLRD